MTGVGSLLEIDGLAKRFGATRALDGVTLDVRAGEVHAIVGENGAGKTTLMSIVAGSMAADRGAMRLDGKPYAPQTPLEARRRGVALIHQELSLCTNLTVAENIMLGGEPAHFGWIDREATRRRATELLDQFGHPEIAPDRVVATLPLPARQVVEVCRIRKVQYARRHHFREARLNGRRSMGCSGVYKFTSEAVERYLHGLARYKQQTF